MTLDWAKFLRYDTKEEKNDEWMVVELKNRWKDESLKGVGFETQK